MKIVFYSLRKKSHSVHFKAGGLAYDCRDLIHHKSDFLLCIVKMWGYSYDVVSL